MDRTRLHRLGGALGALGLAMSMPVMATDYMVDSAVDPVDPTVMDGLVSLREAVMAASSNTAVGDAPAGEADGDTITIGGVPYPLLAANGPLMITDDVVITGSAGANINGTANAVQLAIIDAPGETVALDTVDLVDGTAESGGALLITADSTVTLNNVNLTGNVGTGDAATSGGAIDNAGTLTITDGSFSNNSATGASGSGGAIITSGTLSVSGTSFTGNTANRAGGAIEQRTDDASMTLTNVTADMNEVFASPGNGGFLHISQAGGATISMGSFTNNTAGNEGGGLWNGGGLMTIDGATITGNTAAGVNAHEGGGGIFNQGGTLTITDSTIDGNSATGAAGSGGGIFNNAGGVLSVTGGSISGNSAVRAGGGIEDRSLVEGGSDPLSPAGSITLSGVTMDGNTVGDSPGNGGGLHATGPTAIDITGATITNNVAAREGGGLWNGSGPMTIADTVITGNAANGDAGDDGGGGIFNQMGTITITGINTDISDNTALGVSGSGGGIFNNNGSISITDATISGNVANRAGGGIEDLSNSAVPDVANPTIRLTGVTLDGNSAGTNVGSVTDAVPNPGNGGGLHITGEGGGANGGYVIVTNSTITNNIATEGGGLWNFGSPSTLDVSGSSFTGNIANGTAATNGGGALFNNGGIMNVSDTMVMNNTASEGQGSGGGLLADGGTVTITGSTFSGNSANRAGGAIEITSADTPPVTLTLTEVTLDGNDTGPDSPIMGAPGNGGGLHVSGAGNSVTIDRSTISNNIAANEGGGLWNFDDSDMMVWNSTIFGNTANGAPGGGGIFNRASSRTTTLNVTIAGNTASAGPGGGVANADGSAVYEATNTLIGDNTGMSNNDLSGEISAGDYNLVEDTTGATLSGSNNVTGMDPGLDASGLANNGGPTLTVALADGSPAIDAGLTSTCTGMAINNVDQRGLTRDDPCDIGAFEVVDNPVATVGGNGTTGDAPPVNADTGDTDVAALGFGVTAPAGEALTVAGFSGTLSGSGNFDADISNIDVVLDANGNGVADAGEATVPASITVNDAANTFEVSFSPARTVPAGSTENYVLAVDFNSTLAALAMPMLAGGSLLLVGLAGASGLRRRRQLMLLAALTGAVALTACDGSTTLTRVDAAPGSATFQFTLTGVDAQGATSGQTAQPAGLPLAGPVITVTRQ